MKKAKIMSYLTIFLKFRMNCNNKTFFYKTHVNLFMIMCWIFDKS